MRGIDDACLCAWLCHGCESGRAEGQRASEPIARFGRQAIPSCHGEAAELTASQGCAALVEERRREQRRFPQRLNLAADWRVRRLNRDGAVHAKLRGGADRAVRIGQEEAAVGDVDGNIPAWSLHRLGQDLTILHQDVLRIDVHAAAAACAIEDRSADRAVGEFDRAARGRRDLDRAAARVVGFCRHRAICHGELAAGVDRNVARGARAGAAG